MIDHEGALRIEVLEERLHAVGLAGIENEVEIGRAEGLDRFVPGQVEDETLAVREEAEVGGERGSD
jgi:hypothetical protein